MEDVVFVVFVAVVLIFVRCFSLARGQHESYICRCIVMCKTHTYPAPRAVLSFGCGYEFGAQARLPLHPLQERCMDIF